MKINNRGSAMLVGLVIVILLTILAVSFLARVINLSKAVSAVGSSTEAYTIATGLIEKQLMGSTNMTKETPWNIVETSEGNMDSMSSTGRKLMAYTGGSLLPKSGKGNSPYDQDWNIISLGKPVQIVIPETITWNNVHFQFRVPHISGIANTGALSSSGFILWTIGNSGSSLYASGETNILGYSHSIGSDILVSALIGITNAGSASNFESFYSGIKGTCTDYQCTLKLSMIRPFETLGGQTFPFLEYQINFNEDVPSQYMVIDSSASVRGYFRSRQIRIPQITTNTAIDFAILQ